MITIPDTIWWNTQNIKDISISIEPSSLGGKGTPAPYQLTTPHIIPPQNTECVECSNKPRTGFNVLAVASNNAYWRSPDGYIFELSAVMTAKVLRFGAAETLKLSIAFEEDGCIKGLILEEHIQYHADNCIQGSQVISIAELTSQIEPGTELYLPQRVLYGRKIVGKVIYMGQGPDNCPIFYQPARKYLFMYDLDALTCKTEYIGHDNKGITHVNDFTTAIQNLQTKRQSETLIGESVAYKLPNYRKYPAILPYFKRVAMCSELNVQSLCGELQAITGTTDDLSAISTLWELLGTLDNSFVFAKMQNTSRIVKFHVFKKRLVVAVKNGITNTAMYNHCVPDIADYQLYHDLYVVDFSMQQLVNLVQFLNQLDIELDLACATQ